MGERRAAALLALVGLACQGPADDLEPMGATEADPTSPSGFTTAATTDSPPPGDTGTSGMDPEPPPGETEDEDTTGGGPPPPDAGEPLPEAPVGEWQWIEIDGAFCRDGSPAGFGYRYGESPNVMIYFMAGGACFNAGTCGITPPGIVARDGGNAGVFDTVSPDNPVADWNHVFVSYCTGDVHAGANPGGGTQAGTEGQQFVGWTNYGLFLPRIVGTFIDAEKVLVTGSSAGGFGAIVNFDRTFKAFGGLPEFSMINDSGTPLPDEWSAPCLQKTWRETWNLEETFLADCEACNASEDGGGIVEYARLLAERYPDQTLAHITSTQDSTMRLFHAYGLDDCARMDNLLPLPYPGADYEAGVLALRDEFFAGEPWGSFYVPGTTHTFISSGFIGWHSAEGVALPQWVADIVDGAPVHLGP